MIQYIIDKFKYLKKMLEEKEVIKQEERFREHYEKLNKLKREGYIEFEGMR